MGENNNNKKKKQTNMSSPPPGASSIYIPCKMQITSSMESVEAWYTTLVIKAVRKKIERCRARELL
ncbi:hypothetical protein, partial [Klebsiella pneumoniae]|uniref:hypothetical protein n=1 Tax=Klebsiella pneumoniae TaxID=573 RepID=UPI0027307BC8